jgi:hypothetical protein
MVLAGTPAVIVMPLAELAGVIVRKWGSAFKLRPLAVSEIVSVRIVMSAPSFVPVGALVTTELVMTTSAPAPGTSGVEAPPSIAVQLLSGDPTEPFEAAQTFEIPAVLVPFQ